MPLFGLFVMKMQWWRDYRASSRTDFRVDVVADITDSKSIAIRRERKGERDARRARQGKGGDGNIRRTGRALPDHLAGRREGIYTKTKHVLEMC
jgi:hypothetical protein